MGQQCDGKSKFNNTIEMKNIFLILLILVPLLTKAQVTLIPDIYFEQYLVNLGYDTDGVVNGQISTVDALTVKEINFLKNFSGPVYDLTGLNDFINLEVFKSNFNDVASVDFTNLSKLKKLYFNTFKLTTFDVTPLIALEELEIDDTAADAPYCKIRELNFSNSLNFKSLKVFRLPYLELINMRNNTADTVSFVINWGGTICIEVDDPVAATNGLPPYDTWSITLDGVIDYPNYYYSDKCTLSIEKFVNENFKIYPNPATEYVSIEQKETDGVTLKSVQILESSGKWIKSVKDNFNQIDVSHLSKGMYLFVIQTDKGNKTEKIIIK